MQHLIPHRHPPNNDIKGKEFNLYRHAAQDTNLFSKDINLVCNFADLVKSIYKEIISLVAKNVDFSFVSNAHKHDFDNIY